ncbi:hypothetical protein PVK06_029176 [Gossypium arboreum]|uniref:Reverse transcriptase n=1 Tax=Gossypium arboreum TaxID=29729 RepID=A0ABR0P5Z7_GOSAR|nr:hypothetical protein PVK06_029176 [Gossypium arboreum]
MHGFEKKGGLSRDEGRMESFRRTLEACQLIDVRYSGTWFTWERGNLLETNIQERLDRGVATAGWISMFSEVKVQHLVHNFSDHCPLLINTKKYDEKQRSISFKFEAWWVWKILSLKNVYGSHLRNTSFEVRKSEKRLESLGREYFTTQRRRKNWIHKLQNDEGRETEALNEIEAVARSYFHNLFTAGNRGNYDYVLSGIDCCMSEGDNEKLTATYTSEEIREAVFEMGATKAPGEDGFPALFY